MFKKRIFFSLIAVFIFFVAGLTTGLASSKYIFHIKRNKNKNIVQYSIRYDKDSCTPTGQKPIYVYWRNLEVSPTDTESIHFWEQPAYGIKSQKVIGNKVEIHLKALPTKKIVTDFVKSKGKCSINSTVQINGSQGIIKEIYVFAKEGLVLPTVVYIDIIGWDLKQKTIKERIFK